MNNNIEELEMLCLALKDTKHGLFLFRAEAKEQDKIVDEIKQYFGSNIVSSKNASLINWDNEVFKISFFKNWKEQAPDDKIFILYNLQTVAKTGHEIEFCQELNHLRDELVDLDCIFIFGMSSYFAVYLSQNAPDLYSFFGYQANFKFENDDKQDNNSNIYTGDIVVARERLLEIYHEIKAFGIDNYKSSVISLKYLVDFLDSWNEIYPYLSNVYHLDIMKIIKKVLNIIDELKDSLKDLIFLSDVYNTLGDVYDDLGQYDKSLENYQKALKIATKILGQEHLTIAKIYNNLGCTYSKQGKYQEALENCQKALKMGEKILGQEHSTIATGYNNLGYIYSKQGKYQEAIENYQKAIKIEQKIPGQEDSTIARDYNNLGCVYSKQGKYQEALKNYLKALKVAQKILGQEHSITAMCYNNLGYIYSKQGKNQEALENYQKALKIAQKILGQEHPDTIAINNNIKLLINNLKK